MCSENSLLWNSILTIPRSKLKGLKNKIKQTYDHTLYILSTKNTCMLL